MSSNNAARISDAVHAYLDEQIKQHPTPMAAPVYGRMYTGYKAPIKRSPNHIAAMAPEPNTVIYKILCALDNCADTNTAQQTELGQKGKIGIGLLAVPIEQFYERFVMENENSSVYLSQNKLAQAFGATDFAMLERSYHIETVVDRLKSHFDWIGKEFDEKLMRAEYSLKEFSENAPRVAAEKKNTTVWSGMKAVMQDVKTTMVGAIREGGLAESDLNNILGDAHARHSYLSIGIADWASRATAMLEAAQEVVAAKVKQAPNPAILGLQRELSLAAQRYEAAKNPPQEKTEIAPLDIPLPTGDLVGVLGFRAVASPSVAFQPRAA